ncbi:MAG: hypothetical protein WB586_19400 [Chthoniobacterales bacterium]
MADPEEDKGYLAARLEEDRRGMAQQVTELKKDYNVTRQLNASIRQYPWAWVAGAALIGWLLSRVPARRKEVYLWKRHFRDENPREIRVVPPSAEKPDFREGVWSFTRPFLSTYLARELYKRVGGPREQSPQ